MMPSADRTKKTFSFLAVLFLIFILIPDISADEKNLIKSTLPPGYSCDLILVPDVCDWLLPLVAPVVTVTGSKERMPYLLSASGGEEHSGMNLIEKIAPRKLLHITAGREAVIDYEDANLETDTLFLDKTAYAAGITIARIFFSRTDTIICVPENEPDAMILGAMIACRLKCAIIPVSAKNDRQPFITLVNDNKIKNIIWISVPGEGMKRTNMPEFISGLKLTKSAFFGSEVYDYFFRLTGKDQLKNIIVTRTYPADKIPQAAIFFITPYLSMIRNSCIILSPSGAVSDVENRIFTLIKKYSLKPRTLTIAGDRDEIKTTFGDTIPELNKLKVEFEPCSLPDKKKAFSLEVGRLPFRTSVKSLEVITRTLMHEFFRDPARHNVLMFSNPQTTYPALPLCETISRATCTEFRNAAIRVNEYYSIKPYEPELFERAEQATLIIYQGHIFDLILFNDNSNYYFDEYISEKTGNIASGNDNSISLSMDAAEDNQGKLHGRRLPTVNELSGFPFVLLQSCKSLDPEIAEKVFDLGGAGIIGSNSNINSASGSAFIKAFCDALIYKQCTVGEALRDARNYTLCLIDLKDKRKHSEQDKVKRVAYSFRLWGDPEFSPFPKNKVIYIQPSIAKFVSPDTITISASEKLLAESTTEKYSLTALPGMETAGIVKRLRKKPVRKILPFFYFQIPVPAGFSEKPNLVLKDEAGETARAVFRIDPANRFLHIVYYPESIVPGKKYKLVFSVDKNMSEQQQ